MTTGLLTFVDLFDRALVTASHLLDLAKRHAAAHDLDERALLGWRLVEDMMPLGFQVMVVVNFSRQWPPRVAGLPVPDGVSADLDVSAFQSVIAEARSELAELTERAFAGREDVPITFRINEGMEPTLPAGQWLAVFAITNIHFHLSMIYAILRARGVQLAKPDLFARGL